MRVVRENLASFAQFLSDMIFLRYDPLSTRFCWLSLFLFQSIDSIIHRSCIDHASTHIVPKLPKGGKKLTWTLFMYIMIAVK